MILNKYIKILALLLITQSFLFSQEINISGEILDIHSQKPISDVNIFIKDKNIGTTSNIDGYFLLLIKNNKQKEVTLNIKMIGYDEQTISVDLVNTKPSCPTCNVINMETIFLHKKDLEFEPVSIHSHKNESTQISDITISGSELNENLKGNIATTLINYPNIGINSFGSVVSKPSLRGFSGDRFLLTNDGDETGDLSQSSIDHVITLDMSEVNQIEIIRGPKSLAYGMNAIGGVVNTSLIGSPSVRVDKLYQRISLGRESYNNGIYGNIMLYAPFKNNQINIFLSNRKTDDETSSIGILDNTESNTSNYKASFTNYMKNSYINFIIEDFNMDYGIPPNPGGHITGVDILLNKKTAQINYHQDIMFNQFKQLDIKYNFIDYIHLELVNDSVNNNNIFDIYNQGDYHVALAKETHNFKVEINAKNLILGFELNKKNFEPSGFYLTPETNETFLSIYGFQDTKNTNFDLNLLSAFRIGYLQSNPTTTNFQYTQLNIETSQIKKRIFNTASLSFGIKKTINKIELNSWIMHTMRPPRVEELYSDGPHLGTYAYEIGNPELEVEKIYGIENSVIFNGKPFELSFITFYNYSPYYYEMAKMGDCPEALDWNPLSGTSHPCAGADFIDWGSGEFGFLYKYKSRGSKATIKGAEINLKYNLNDFFLNYNFSFVNGDNKTANRPLSYMNPTKQILTLNYNKVFTNYKLRFSKIHSQNRLGEFETYTPGALLTDFIITYNYKVHSIAIQLNNVFDEKYYNHLSRIKDITPEPGKNIHLVYKVLF